MQELFEVSPKTFNLLSIGQRGVGKTVFLAGSYSQLQDAPIDLTLQNASNGINSYKLTRRKYRSVSNPRTFWFECQDRLVQENLEKILDYIQRTGFYPPATTKITNFNFQLKYRVQSAIKTLCNFQWWDVPGEACDLHNEEFQKIILDSHGCCVFISAEFISQQKDYLHQDYLENLKHIFNQVVAIASIVHCYHLNYAFALILTKCDLLKSGGEIQAQIDRKIQPLTMRLDALKTNYKLFSSAIPISVIDGTSTLDAQGAAAPLLWLLSELNKHHKFQDGFDLNTLLISKPILNRFLIPRWILISAITSFCFLAMGTSFWVSLELSKQLPTYEQQP